MVNKMFNSSTIVLTSSSFIQNSESQKWGNILSAFKIRLIAKVKFVKTNKIFLSNSTLNLTPSAHQILQAGVPTRLYRSEFPPDFTGHSAQKILQAIVPTRFYRSECQQDFKPLYSNLNVGQSCNDLPSIVVEWLRFETDLHMSYHCH